MVSWQEKRCNIGSVLSAGLLEGWLGCTAISGFVLFRMSSNVFQCPLDGLRDWGWRWKVGSLWDEAVLISSVGEADASAIWSRVLVPTLGDLRFLFRISEILYVALLLSLDLIGCFVAAIHTSILLDQTLRAD
jgi:hypothetical protein